MKSFFLSSSPFIFLSVVSRRGFPSRTCAKNLGTFLSPNRGPLRFFSLASRINSRVVRFTLANVDFLGSRFLEEEKASSRRYNFRGKRKEIRARFVTRSFAGRDSSKVCFHVMETEEEYQKGIPKGNFKKSTFCYSFESNQKFDYGLIRSFLQKSLREGSVVVSIEESDPRKLRYRLSLRARRLT